MSGCWAKNISSAERPPSKHLLPKCNQMRPAIQNQSNLDRNTTMFNSSQYPAHQRFKYEHFNVQLYSLFTVHFLDFNGAACQYMQTIHRIYIDIQHDCFSSPSSMQEANHQSPCALRISSAWSWQICCRSMTYWMSGRFHGSACQKHICVCTRKVWTIHLTTGNWQCLC